MIRPTLALFLITLLIPACAAPQNPPLSTGEGGGEGIAPTATILLLTETPAVVATTTLAPTATLEPTATPTLPDGLREHIANGGGFDEEKGVAWNEEGLVMWAMDANGEWIEYNGIVSLPAQDGSGAPPLEVPFYVDANFAFAAITDELPWGEPPYKYREKQVKAVNTENDRYWDAIKTGSVGHGVDITMTNNTEVTAEISIAYVQLPEMNMSISRLGYASADTDYYFKRVLIFTDGQTLANQLEQNDPNIYIPSPDEVK